MFKLYFNLAGLLALYLTCLAKQGPFPNAQLPCEACYGHCARECQDYESVKDCHCPKGLVCCSEDDSHIPNKCTDECMGSCKPVNYGCGHYEMESHDPECNENCGQDTMCCVPRV
ncbi:uncharacterized protein LOC102803823 [Saccoglossus kowalevskii]|uniref:Uncharacterized protein LOC102803823 n=1 Tax=Saccoglossus kowalevskii TaxID=10224 RepID=A0ABM0MRW2_SACKO|nr:PREDICTED: uncharacterized protein LOC102803823 [Saccoglossus kowalevskii]